MPLLTLADLNQPRDHLDWYLERANQLSQIYFDHVAHDQDESYSYKVEIFGSKGRSGGIHASEMSKCMRLMVYSILNTERRVDSDKTDINMLMRFKLGNAIHAMLQNDWHRIAEKSNGQIQFEDEVAIKPSLGGVAQYWGLSSSCDGIVTLLHDGVPYLRIGIEIKSMSDKQFEKLRQPQEDHMEQTTLYMAALDLPLMWVIYYNKSNSNISTSYPPYLYQFNYKLWAEKLQPRFGQAYDFANRQELPERTEGMPCRWCPFAWTCHPSILKPQATKRPALAQGMVRRQR